jgi:hypothetical protein
MIGKGLFMKPSMFNINQSINHHLKTGFIEITEERLAREIVEKLFCFSSAFKIRKDWPT